jgi:diguanylate cyclase (GGDEF)-like protein/PAS domain S-box-containing protein
MTTQRDAPAANRDPHLPDQAHDREAAEAALRDSEARYRAVIDSLHDGLIVHTVDTVLAANASASRILGVPVEELLDSESLLRLAVFDEHGVFVPVERRPSVHVLTTGEPSYDVVQGINTPDGERRWFLTNAIPLCHPDEDTPYAVALSFADITDRLAAQEQNVRLAGIVESTSDLVGVVDWTTGQLIYLNRSARDLFGYVDTDLSTIHHLDLFTPDAAITVRDSLAPAIRNGEPWTGELPMFAADGSIVLVWQTLVADRNPDGSVYQISAVGRDVTERRRFEQELAWQATHDSHTGLPNRALLLDHLELSLARARRDKHLVALLFLDLDRFKQVNDTHGHDAGDDLLAQTAARISGVLRPSDTVARIGGDEFVVLAEDVDDEAHAIAIAQRVATAIDHEPFVLADQPVDVTASIGIALSRGHEAHPEALLRDADAAMYRAKDLGRARLELFDESMRERAERRNELADQLASGIEHDDIAVYYQPCVDLETGEIRAVEALARWTHPERGVLSPYEFIALAEETGLIVGLGLAVLSKACHQARQWEERFGLDAPRVHVNLSARQLQTRNLPTLVEGVLAGTQLSPGKLCLEITESVLMDDAAAVIDTLWALKAIGVSLAIDDFGTGYSSLSYLRRFPVDVLKVDQSFVDGLGPDPEDSAIVAAIINLAASLELDAVAEGVETVEQLDRLRALGCHSAQGFLFSEPRPAAEIEHLFGTPFAL